MLATRLTSSAASSPATSLATAAAATVVLLLGEELAVDLDAAHHEVVRLGVVRSGVANPEVAVLRVTVLRSGTQKCTNLFGTLQHMDLRSRSDTKVHKTLAL